MFLPDNQADFNPAN